MTRRLAHTGLPLWLRRVALAALPIGASALAACDCPPVDREYLIRQPDEATSPLVDQCRLGDCLPLCQHLTGRTSFDHCEMHTDRDGYLIVHVGWRDICG